MFGVVVITVIVLMLSFFLYLFNTRHHPFFIDLSLVILYHVIPLHTMLGSCSYARSHICSFAFHSHFSLSMISFFLDILALSLFFFFSYSFQKKFYFL